MPHTLSDVLIVLRPDRARSTAALEAAMREAVEPIPGLSASFTTPLGMRIDEGLGGTPADLAVRIFGPDLATLGELAERAAAIMGRVDGVADVRAERPTGLPQRRGSGSRRATSPTRWRSAWPAASSARWRSASAGSIWWCGWPRTTARTARR